MKCILIYHRDSLPGLKIIHWTFLRSSINRLISINSSLFVQPKSKSSTYTVIYKYIYIYKALCPRHGNQSWSKCCLPLYSIGVLTADYFCWRNAFIPSNQEYQNYVDTSFQINSLVSNERIQLIQIIMNNKTGNIKKNRLVDIRIIKQGRTICT